MGAFDGDTNLLQETLKEIQNRKYLEYNILYCRYYNNEVQNWARFTWEEFKELANINYDSGFGGQEIEPTLRIVFYDGSYLYRKEYDGSEWWVYEDPPMENKLEYIKPESLKVY